MKRPAPLVAVAVAVAVVCLAVLIVFAGKNIANGPKSTPVPSPTPTVVVVPATPTPPKRPVHLASAYKIFVKTICQALAHHNASVLESNLIDVQVNTGVYYGPFNRGEGIFGPADEFATWLSSGNQHCVRVAASVQHHGVVATAGWTDSATSPYGRWALFDLDRSSGAWKINDETFGTRSQVMNSFFANYQRSVKYPAGV